MTDYIAEYSPQQGAFRISWGLEEAIKKNMRSIEKGHLPDYYPVAGPFATHDEASAAIASLRKKFEAVEERRLATA